MFRLYSWLLLTDPQVYRISHYTHHLAVHTYQDIEFHPLGRIPTRFGRIVNNLLEVFAGSSYLYLISLHALRSHPRFRPASTFTALAAAALLVAGLASCAHYGLHVPARDILLSWLLSFWIGGILQHHSQLLEHGGIIAEGTSLGERNLLTRNLKREGVSARIFLLLTHWDSEEHTLHHTAPLVYARPFRGALPMPPASRYLTLPEYLRFVRRFLAGE
jgi:hypothetical protein